MNFPIYLSLIVLAFSAHANREETVSSPGGGQPYKIVVKDSSKDSDKDPGFYARNNGEWSPIIPGEVLVDPKRGPFVQLLNLAALDDRIPVASVIDGRLQIFNVNTDPKVAESRFVLGAAPVEEIATGNLLPIPLIQQSDDFSIYQSTEWILSHQRLLILASFRQGDTGLTVALRLKRGEGAKVELDGSPLILDHTFRKTEELNAMVRKTASGIQVYSEILQRSLISRLKLGDYGDYQTLVSAHIDAQTKCMQENKNFCNFGNLARWNAETGKAIQTDTLEIREVLSSFDFYMKWQISGAATLQIGLKDAGSQKQNPTMRGRLRLTPEGKIWRVLTSTSNPAPVLFAIENDLYMVAYIGTAVSIAKLGPLEGGKLPQKMSATVSEWTINGRHEFRLFVSELHGKEEDRKGVTQVYKIETGHPGDFMPVGQPLKLSDHFYTLGELRRRVLSEDGATGLLFDNTTPPQESGEIYTQIHDKSTPYVNVTNSGRGGLKYVYTHPTFKKILAPKVEYKEFAVRDASENPTGVYSYSQNPPLFVRGHLLNRLDKARDEVPDNGFDLLRQAHPIKSQKLGEVSAKIFAVDSTYREGRSGFSLILSLNAKTDKFTASAREIGNFSFPLKDVVDVRLFSGRKDHSDRFYVVLFTAAGGHCLIVPVTARDNELHVASSPMAYEVGGLSPDEFAQRLVHDHQLGDLHLIMTEGISPASRDFAVWSFSTRRQVFPKREHGDSLTFDFDNNVAAQFQTISDESRLSWKVKPFRPDESDIDANNASDMARSSLFSELRRILEESADPTQAARRRVVIVPEQIKPLAMEFVRNLYLAKSRRDVSPGSHFNRFNRSFGLHIFDPNKASADAFFENFEIIQARPKEKGVVVADVALLTATGRPTSLNVSKPFLLEIPQFVANDEKEGEGVMHMESVTPHALYLIAAGAPVPYEDFRKKIPAPIATTLLIGTKEEYEAIKADADSEMSAGIDKAFEVTELPPLTLDSKTDLLNEIMSRPDIKGLKYEFDASAIVNASLTPEEQQKKLFEYAATRVEGIALSRNANTFSAFMEFVALYLEKILTDPVVRNTRKVDRSFIERVLKVQFNLALNLADLPPDDPRVILSSENALFELHRAGMLGEFALKAEIIRLTLAQLNHDPARVMPSTWIWAGEPGTGKSKAWEALAKMLKLKMFRRGQKDNSGANGFYLDTVRIKKGDQAAIDQVINDLNMFVTSPAGSAGFIFFDDLSFADDNLGKAIVQWIRGLQQAERGIYRWTKSDGTVATCSVQNLSIGVAMNFTDNKALLEQFKGDDISSLVGKIVATGSRFGMDKSFVDRFGGVYNFDKFHESVKEPSLNQALLEAAQKKMARTGQYIVVDPALVRQAAKAFPQLGARPFLSKTTEAILTQPDHQQTPDSKVFAVIPKSEKEIAEAEAAAKAPTTGAWGQESAEVKQWVNKHARVVELQDGLSAELMLTRLMIPSFRSPILESLVYALQVDSRFKSDSLIGAYFQTPALFATYDHLLRAETIPLKDLGLKHTNQSELNALIEDLSTGETSPFVISFPTEGTHRSNWSRLGLGGQSAASKDSRRDVIVKYTPRIQDVIHKHLLRVLNVRNLQQMNNVEGWLKNLPERVPFEREALGRELTDLLFQFMREFQSRDLHEAQSSSQNAELDPYASTRFFLMAIDHAITKLPWTDLSHQMSQALKLVSQDMVLGQSVGVQNWLFNPDDRASLLKPTTTNFIREMVEFNPLVRETSDADRARPRGNFDSRCENFLVSNKGGR